MNREIFPAPKNNNVVCHLTAESIRKVHFEVCSNCHERPHQNNQPQYIGAQCQSCRSDDNRGHTAPLSGAVVIYKR